MSPPSQRRFFQTWCPCVLVDVISSYTTANRPFPLRRNGMQYTCRHVWGASEGLLGRIFHCYYMRTWPMFRRLLVRVQGKYRAASTPIQSSSIGLSTVVVRTPSDLLLGYVPVYSNGEFAPASLPRHPRRDVTYSTHIVMLVGKVYCQLHLQHV